MTETLASDETGLARAATLLREGRLVAFPTETVYGLGADARSDSAVAGIFAAKNRPRFNPLIVHLPDAGAVTGIARLDGDAARLAQAFWPGPMTLVLPLKPDAGIAPIVTAGLGTVAVRVPAAPLARALIARAGCPIAAPSANPSGRVSATEAAHVLAGLGGRIDAVLDGGPCPVGVESTILAPGPDGVRLLRAGGLPTEAVEACLSAPLIGPERGGTVSSPGQLASHYAPVSQIRLNVTDPEPGEIFLGFGSMKCDLNLSENGDLAEAAARLFRHLQTLDRMGAARIAVAPIPGRGLGRAINDRLGRAAAPR